MLIVGAVVSTWNVLLGPAAGEVLPAVSEAVPGAIEIPREPSPEIPLSVTVRVFPLPETPIVAIAFPVLFRVMSLGDKVLALKCASLYITVKLTELLPLVAGLDGELMTIAGPAVSRVTVLSDDVDVVFGVPARSRAAPAGTAAVTLPSAVKPLTATL